MNLRRTKIASLYLDLKNETKRIQFSGIICPDRAWINFIVNLLSEIDLLNVNVIARTLQALQPHCSH